MQQRHPGGGADRRRGGGLRNIEFSEDLQEQWIFGLFVLFLLVLAGITIWLSFFRQPLLEDDALTPPPFDADYAINEPILPLPEPVGLDPRRVALGKRLFFEPRLSGDDTISCASCHDLSRGGADDKAYSIGIGGAIGEINAPTVFNVAFNIAWFWNGRAETLEDQLDGPILRKDEMGSDWNAIVVKLKGDESYVRAFDEAYEDGITVANIKNALVTFERSLVTTNAPFDRYLKGDYYAIDDEAKKGYQLFKDYGCSSCHQGVNVGGNLFQVFGVVGDYFADRGHITEVDLGRYNVTGREVDRYRFRVPSLRNVALTAPYFHDGSAPHLEDAVYTMARYQLGRHIPRRDVELIVRFLHTLTGEFEGVEGS